MLQYIPQRKDDGRVKRNAIQRSELIYAIGTNDVEAASDGVFDLSCGGVASDVSQALLSAILPKAARAAPHVCDNSLVSKAANMLRDCHELAIGVVLVLSVHPNVTGPEFLEREINVVGRHRVIVLANLYRSARVALNDRVMPAIL